MSPEQINCGTNPSDYNFATYLPTIKDDAYLSHRRALRLHPLHAGNLALQISGHQGQGESLRSSFATSPPKLHILPSQLLPGLALFLVLAIFRFMDECLVFAGAVIIVNMFWSFKVEAT